MDDPLKTTPEALPRDKMKILIWGNTFPKVGGIERFVDKLASGLIGRGHDVVVLSDGRQVETLKDRRFAVETVPIIEPILNVDPAAIILSAQAAKKVISGFEPDVLHYNSSLIDMPIFTMSAMRAKIPIVTSLHLDLAGPLLAQENRTFSAIMRGSTRINSVSRHVHALVPSVGCLKEHSVSLIENALPGASAYVPPAPGKRLLCLGRLVHEKGFDQLIAAMTLVVQRHPDAHLTIGGLGPEKAALLAQIEAERLGENVTLIGWIQPEDVHSQMQQANIVVFPSRWEEPFGLVAVEAAIAGRACVGFDVGGIGETIAPGLTGELARAGDIADLAEKICGLFSDPALCDAQGLNAYQEYGNTARFEAMLDQYEALYREAISARV